MVRARAWAGPLAVVFLLASGGRAGASWPGTNGSIAFSSSRDSQRNIYSTTGPSAPDTRLTSVVADDATPSYSPDGRRLVFMSRRTNAALGGVPQVWIMNADGTGQVDLSSDTIPSSEPSWSPDGSKILYSRPEGSGLGQRSQIWVMNADGSGKHPFFSPFTGSSENQAAWSPTGNKVAFVSTRDGGSQIYVVGVDPSTATASGSPLRLSDLSTEDTKPDWSPSPVGGSFWLAFAAGPVGSHQIFKMREDGTGRFQITNNAADNFEPAFSPDGNSIVFTSHPQATAVVLTASVNSTGGPIVNLTDPTGTEGSNDEPSWGVVPVTVPPPNVPEGRLVVLFPLGAMALFGAFTLRSRGGRAVGVS